MEEELKVIISGGGTGGHIFPAISIANALKAIKPNIKILFVGAEGRMEMKRVPAAGYEIKGLPVSGFDRKNLLKNIKVLFKAAQSRAKAKQIIKEFRPHIAVGVGGYASGPTLSACEAQGIPIVLQEQNSYAGITNKLLARKAQKICVAYEHMERFFPASKIMITGNPVRQELLSINVSREVAIKSFGLDPSKKTILIIGGSLGAQAVNDAVRRILPELLKDFQVVHLCGKGKQDDSKNDLKGYVQYEYIESELADLFAMADIVISRAGANAICELQALKKPNLLIPLSANASRGDQILNARSFEKQGFSMVLEEEAITDEVLLKAIHDLYDHRENYRAAMENAPGQDSISVICDLIRSCQE